jgi:hypothetical protein
MPAFPQYLKERFVPASNASTKRFVPGSPPIEL